jgi:hypothetical protein
MYVNLVTGAEYNKFPMASALGNYFDKSHVMFMWRKRPLTSFNHYDNAVYIFYPVVEKQLESHNKHRGQT